VATPPPFDPNEAVTYGLEHFGDMTREDAVALVQSGTLPEGAYRAIRSLADKSMRKAYYRQMELEIDSRSR
jgi:hypothetical protein